MLAKLLCTKRKSASAPRCLRCLGATIDIVNSITRTANRSGQGVFSHRCLRKANTEDTVITGLGGLPGITALPMPMHALAALPPVEVVAPVVIALLFIVATSAFREPHRQHFMAIMLAGAGAAYLNGGLGLWEFACTAVMTACAYQGLSSYRYIGLGWLLHTAWDVLHHLYGNPIVPFSATSSLRCAMYDHVID